MKASIIEELESEPRLTQGNLQIIACAGSGKTEFVSTRIAYLDFEKHFAQFLDKADDVTRFAKLAEEYTKFKIEYLNHKGAISYYYPDFVAEQKLPDGSTKRWLIETKGWEQPDVPLKDARAKEWCADASRLTSTPWQYLKIKYTDYIALTNNLSLMPSYTFETLKTQLEIKPSGIELDLQLK